MKQKIITLNDDEIFLSVCLVTYNHDFFIRKAIESAINQQTTFAYEIIIGEDYSVDNTRKICEEYQQKYPNIIRLLPSEKNLGLKENFLRTFHSCKGKYIAYLEGDDYWLSTDKLQRQVNIMENDPDVAMVHTNCKMWDVKNNRVYDHLISTDGVCIREDNIGLINVIAEFEGNYRPVKTSSCCYRKALLEEILKEDEFAFRNPEFPTQDFQLFLELSMKGKFAFIPEEMTMIGLHDSLSAANNEGSRILFRLGFYKIGIYYIQKYHLPQKTIQIWTHRQLHYLLNVAFKNKNKKLAKIVKGEADLVNYQIPFAQRVLYLGTIFGLMRRLVLPFWKISEKKKRRALKR